MAENITSLPIMNKYLLNSDESGQKPNITYNIAYIIFISTVCHISRFYHTTGLNNLLLSQ